MRKLQGGGEQKEQEKEKGVGHAGEGRRQEAGGRRQEAGGRRQEAGGRRRGEETYQKGPKSENLISKEKRIENRGLTKTNPNPNPDP